MASVAATGMATTDRLIHRSTRTGGSSTPNSSSTNSVLKAATKEKQDKRNHFNCRRSTDSDLRERTNTETSAAAMKTGYKEKSGPPSHPYSGLGIPGIPIGLSAQAEQPRSPSPTQTWSVNE